MKSEDFALSSKLALALSVLPAILLVIASVVYSQATAIQNASGDRVLLPETPVILVLANVLFYTVPLSAVVGYPYACTLAVRLLRSSAKKHRPSAIIALVLMGLFTLAGFIALIVVIAGILIWVSIGA